MPASGATRTHWWMTTLEAMAGSALVWVLVFATVAGVVAGVSLWRLSRLSSRLRRLEQIQQQFAENFHGLTAGAVGQGSQLAQMEQQLGRLRDRLDQLASSEGSGSGAAFNTAIRLARKGVCAREIMETCGLSEMEADLVILLHREREGG